MKINKKIVNSVLALAIAVPMMGNLAMGDAFAAEVVPFTKVSTTGETSGLKGAKFEFYKDGVKIFTVSTNDDGSIDPTSIDPINNKIEYIKNGNLELDKGSYSYLEIAAPTGYILNPSKIDFTVTDGVKNSLKPENVKIGNNAVVYLKAVDVNKKGLSGAVLDLYNKEGKVIATLTTDSNGNILDTSTTTGEFRKIADIIDGALVFKTSQSGLYIKEKSAPSGYKLQTNEYKLVVESGKASTTEVIHERGGSSAVDPSDPKNPGNPVNQITTDTGLKLSVLDKMYDGLQNVKLGVYRVDSKGNIIEKVFSGKTGKDGSFDINNTTIGKDLIAEGGVLDLKPGKYMYRIENVDGMKKHYVDIKDGQVTKRTFKLSDGEIGYLNTSKTNGNVRSTSNHVSTTYGNSGTNNTNNTTKKLLAKTGSENPIAYTLTGLALAASGAFIFMKK